MLRLARPALPAIAFVLAFLPLSSVSGPGPAHAANGCLTAPNAPASQGTHWYYRIERPSMRKCWRLVQKDTREPRAEIAAVQPQPAAAEPVSPPDATDEAATRAEPQRVISMLITRNVSNTGEIKEEPSPGPSSNARGPATAPTERGAAAVIPAGAPEQPVPAPRILPDKSAAASVPGSGLVLTAVGLLGLAGGAAFGLSHIVRRRADVLETVRQADEASFHASPATAGEDVALRRDASTPAEVQTVMPDAAQWHSVRPADGSWDEGMAPRRRRARV